MPKEAEDLLGQANLLYAKNRCAPPFSKSQSPF